MLSEFFHKDTKYFCPAILALADGSVFHGRSIGSKGYVVAELVFNTSMTGYQEILTDPSYKGQIVTLTYPHIGNTGINNEDIESDCIHASGLVVRDCPEKASNFRSNQSLQDYLCSQNIVAISDVSTRSITHILRQKGAQGACIYVGEDTKTALDLAKNFSGMSGQDLTKSVSINKSIIWSQGIWHPYTGFSESKKNKDFHVVAYDFGIKRNILRLLVDRGCDVTLVPSNTPAEDAYKLNPDGIFLSNGPGDPEACTDAINIVSSFLKSKLPIFGICFGHQIIGLAIGAKTVKMKTGHHGNNHPVQCLFSKNVFITSQNHGFMIDGKTLPSNTRITHLSLFDGSVQGFEFIDRPAFCFQGHPEASPGPHEMVVLFDKFVRLMIDNQNKK
ncbi:MAG: glutamine-hydrolyzing carbamoyl-phosphate synthase small subunit [Bordetella sp.]|nr:MAG: glutamine-hydrolyzing carbamoyl-phosphate synthase small subunit [Bordetella sp.]